MKLNMKSLILSLLVATLVTAIVGLQPERASAVPTVGVSVGDWAEYAFVRTGNLTLVDTLFNLTHAKVTVTEIAATNITSDILENYLNGTEQTIVNVVDINTGYGNGSGLFIGANLGTGDLIYPGDVSTDEWAGATINETITKNYLGSDVSVNHFNRTEVFTSTELNVSTSFNYYWYQTTGMVTELSLYVSFLNTTSYGWANIHGMITSIVPEFPTSVIPPLFIVISSLAVILAKKKIHRKRQT